MSSDENSAGVRSPLSVLGAGVIEGAGTLLNTNEMGGALLAVLDAALVSDAAVRKIVVPDVLDADAELTASLAGAIALLTETAVAIGATVATGVLALAAAQSVGVTVTVAVETMVTVTRPSVPITTVGVTRPFDALAVVLAAAAVTEGRADEETAAALDVVGSANWRRRYGEADAADASASAAVSEIVVALPAVELAGVEFADAVTVSVTVTTEIGSWVPVALALAAVNWMVVPAIEVVEASAVFKVIVEAVGVADEIEMAVGAEALVDVPSSQSESSSPLLALGVALGSELPSSQSSPSSELGVAVEVGVATVVDMPESEPEDAVAVGIIWIELEGLVLATEDVSFPSTPPLTPAFSKNVVAMSWLVQIIEVVARTGTARHRSEVEHAVIFHV